jgi:hypothetical protein
MLSTSIVSKVVSFTVTVRYTTFNVLLDPCDFLQTELSESIVKDIGLGTGTVTECDLLSQSQVSGQYLYVWTVTVSS